MFGRRPGAQLGTLLAIALGGALGAPVCDEVAQLIHVPKDTFPWATFWTNLSGVFVLGLFLTLVLDRFRPSRFPGVLRGRVPGCVHDVLDDGRRSGDPHQGRARAHGRELPRRQHRRRTARRLPGDRRRSSRSCPLALVLLIEGDPM